MFDLDNQFFSPVKYISGGIFVTSDKWIHPKRIIDSYELIIVTKGKVYITEELKEYCIHENEILLLKPASLHFGTKYNDSPVSFYWFHFRREDFIDILQGKQYFTCQNINQILIFAKQLVHTAYTPEYPAIYANYIITLILLEILVSLEAQKHGNTLVNEIKEWIRIKSSAGVSVAEVSSHFGYNKDYLTKLFKKHTGLGIKKYIDQMKMSNAKQLILSGKYTLKEISGLLGFEDYNLFLKMFCYHENMTPTQFKEVYYNTHKNIK